MSNNAHELSNRLLNALDNNYNVVDMQAVNEIISILEKFNITKELLETTRLGKHVNELRRKTTDPNLARRAKVLVKRWRDLVIPNVASPGHTGSNRSSAERQVRRLAGTPLTSPALSRQVVSPAVASPRPPSRPAWGGYESDSQDVILVDDDPPAPPAPPPVMQLPHKPVTPQLPHKPVTPQLPHKPITPQLPYKPVTPPVKRPPSPESLFDDKKAKRDKKPKKRRGHSRAGSGTETTASGVVATGGGVTSGGGIATAGAGAASVLGAGAGVWGARNGSAHGERRRNGWRRDAPDACTALVKRLPPVGAKKVKTTKELLEQIQSRKSTTSRPPSPSSPRSPASPDVMVIEPDPCPVVAVSPMRNGGSGLPAIPPVSNVFPLEDKRDYPDCTCGEGEEEGDADCPAARRLHVLPLHVQILHNALLPGVNGTRAPAHPHQFAVRHAANTERAGLFANVVPLYKYSDYADDACVKNLTRVPLCLNLPWTEFAPSPPEPPPPPPTPPPRPYPLPEPEETSPRLEVKTEPPDDPPEETDMVEEMPQVEAEMVGVPSLEPSERLKAPLLDAEEEVQMRADEAPSEVPPEEQFALEPRDHRTVERTKEEPERELDGRALIAACGDALRAVRCTYEHAQAASAYTLTDEQRDEETVRAELAPREDDERDELGRPARPARFAEWHECARLGDLLALPYVVID